MVSTDRPGCHLTRRDGVGLYLVRNDGVGRDLVGNDGSCGDLLSQNSAGGDLGGFHSASLDLHRRDGVGPDGVSRDRTRRQGCRGNLPRADLGRRDGAIGDLRGRDLSRQLGGVDRRDLGICELAGDISRSNARRDGGVDLGLHGNGVEDRAPLPAVKLIQLACHRVVNELRAGPGRRIGQAIHHLRCAELDQKARHFLLKILQVVDRQRRDLVEQLLKLRTHPRFDPQAVDLPVEHQDTADDQLVELLQAPVERGDGIGQLAEAPEQGVAVAALA